MSVLLHKFGVELKEAHMHRGLAIINALLKIVLYMLLRLGLTYDIGFPNKDLFFWYCRQVHFLNIRVIFKDLVQLTSTLNYNRQPHAFSQVFSLVHATRWELILAHIALLQVVLELSF